MKEQPIRFETAKLAHSKGYGIDEINENKGLYLLKDCEIWQPGIPDHWKDKVQEGDYFKSEPRLTNEYRQDHIFNKDILAWAPSQSLLQKWLRENHHICITVTDLGLNTWSTIITKLFDGGTKSIGGKIGTKNFSTYEEALEDGLQEALTLI